MNSIILLLKAHVAGYTRSGKYVRPYERKGDAAASGQLVLFPEPKRPPPKPNPYRGLDPVKSTPDMFADDKAAFTQAAPSAKVEVPAAQPPAPAPASASLTGPQQARMALYSTKRGPTKDEAADPRRKYYVTMAREGRGIAHLAGPFDTHEDALAHVDEARRHAEEVDPRASFDSFGTSGVVSDHHRPGTLNARMGLGYPVDARYSSNEHPAPIPRQSINHLAEMPRERWKAAHREQHEITYHHLPKVKREMDRHQKAINEALEVNGEQQRIADDPLMKMDAPRAAAHQKAADDAMTQYRAALAKHEAAVAQHQTHFKRAEHLARIKEHILPGSGNIRANLAAGTTRSRNEEARYAKDAARDYAAYFKGK